MGTRTSWRTVIASIQPAKQLRHLIRCLSLGALLLSLVGCATVQQKYPDAAAVNSGIGPLCGTAGPGNNWTHANLVPFHVTVVSHLLVSCWSVLDYGWFVPYPDPTEGGIYQETPLAWEIADALAFPLALMAFWPRVFLSDSL
jgi:hypothetical protein